MMSNSTDNEPRVPDEDKPTKQHMANPNKQVDRPDEIISNQDESVVNTDEQKTVTNEQDSDTSAKDTASDKEKGYEEGQHNDSTNEPEFRDSDDQLEFPGEEGK